MSGSPIKDKYSESLSRSEYNHEQRSSDGITDIEMFASEPLYIILYASLEANAVIA